MEFFLEKIETLSDLPLENTYEKIISVSYICYYHGKKYYYKSVYNNILVTKAENTTHGFLENIELMGYIRYFLFSYFEKKSDISFEFAMKIISKIRHFF